MMTRIVSPIHRCRMLLFDKSFAPGGQLHPVTSGNVASGGLGSEPNVERDFGKRARRCCQQTLNARTRRIAGTRRRDSQQLLKAVVEVC
ncbi:MAG: hypothetical protein KDB22_25070 [Planctomycetales bacterium]|nr:hypothetical protein [Planctomycetales bacterium]